VGRTEVAVVVDEEVEDHGGVPADPPQGLHHQYLLQEAAPPAPGWPTATGAGVKAGCVVGMGLGIRVRT